MKEKTSILSSTEMRKNIITGVLAGGMLGAACGFEFGSPWLGLAAGILVGLVIGTRLIRIPIKMRYSMAMTRQVLLAGAFCILASLGFAVLLDQGWTETRPAWLHWSRFAGGFPWWLPWEWRLPAWMNYNGAFRPRQLRSVLLGQCVSAVALACWDSRVSCRR